MSYGFFLSNNKIKKKPIIKSKDKFKSKINNNYQFNSYNFNVKVKKPNIGEKGKEIIKKGKKLFRELNLLNNDKIDVINQLRKLLHVYSPFSSEPVDCVQWIKSDRIFANDYNPNIVAPIEMKLLKRSIELDGFTQPIVAWQLDDFKYEVVDGFHRNKVGREYKDINSRIKNYLPLAIINDERNERSDRIASTIRHNRARGKHRIEGMSDIVLELKNKSWSNERIAKELGMEEDEILRLCQITGLADLFSDQEFSKAWDIKEYNPDFIPLSDDIEICGDEVGGFNNNEDRIFHTWDKWECYKSGFYDTNKDGMTKEQCEQAYCDFLSDKEKFTMTLNKIINEWKYSCEHYLTNKAMNRIAWLGQASMCYALGIPSIFRGGFGLLNEKNQQEANEVALIYLNKWLKKMGFGKVTLEEGLGKNENT